MTSEMDCIVQDFLVESYENLDQLDQALVALEGDAHPQERLALIFRAVHTIKGTCGFLGFSQLEKLSHVGESLLSRMRDGVLLPTPGITSTLLQLLDSIREILANIESTGQEGSKAYDELIRSLSCLQDPVAETRPSTPAPDSDSLISLAVAAIDSPADECPEDASFHKSTDKSCAASSVADAAIRVDVKLLDKLMVLVGELVLVRNRMQQHASCIANSTLLNSSQRLNLITTELQEAVMKTRMQTVGSVLSKFPRIVRDLSLACGKQVALEMEGLETELDKTLIEAIKDPFTHLVRNSIDHGIETPAVRIARGKPSQGRITLRAYHEGGQVNLEIADDGAGIAIERVKCKAVERGLISQDQAKSITDREAMRLIFSPGFSTAETITNVSGRGVGMDVVKANIERIGGTIDVCSQPGIGTTIRIKIPLTLAIIPALMIGRGTDRFAIPQVNVLELVRLEANEAQLGIEFVHGAPVYRLRGKLLPLVSLNQQLGSQTSRRALALGPIVYRPAEGAGSLCNADLGENDAHRAGAFGWAVNESHRDGSAGPINILVLQAEHRRFGLIVDEILDSAEIVVKPLDKRLHGIRVFAGATILGDGKLALILDIVNIAKSVGLTVAESLRDSGSSPSHTFVPGQGPESPRDSATESDSAALQDPAAHPTLLVFQADSGGRMAIPLSDVTRLEEIPSSQIERAGTDWVIQYRGQILPLVDTGKVLGGKSSLDEIADGRPETRPELSVVVCSSNGQPCGFIVDRILDIVDQDIAVRGKATRLGIDYTAVVHGRVTEVVDIATLLRVAEAQQLIPLAT